MWLCLLRYSFRRRYGKQSSRLRHEELTGLQTFSYPSGLGGEPFLLRALANFFNEYFQPHVPVDSSHIVAGPGATACLSALLCGICDLGDAVLVPGTYWSQCIPIMSHSPVPVCTTISSKRCNRRNAGKICCPLDDLEQYKSHLTRNGLKS